jgi:SAM-dependent methyltransferase
MNAKENFPTDDPSPKFWRQMDRLWSDAFEIRTLGYGTAPFENFVNADYQAVGHTLLSMRGKHRRLIELGSGLGVVAIMADRLGFEAVGIEIEPELVDYANQLAKDYQSKAKFYCGSFVPDEYCFESDEREHLTHSKTDSEAAYDQVGEQLADFDLVYAYPWPDEHDFFDKLIQQCGHPNTTLMTYDEEFGVRF